MENKKIILIDDEDVANFVMSKLVKVVHPEAEIVSFTDSSDALDYLFENDPKLVFMDINMPVLTGWDVLDKLKERGLDRKVVILTSSVSTHDETRANQHPGVKGFIVKPARKEIIRQTLQQHLSDSETLRKQR